MTARLLELKEQFLRGEVDKHEFARRVGASHTVLAQYPELLAGTDVAAIELTPAGVTFVSRFGGARFPCDPEDRGIPPVVALNFGAYEAKDFAMLLALVPRGGTFLDVGASIGWYSVHVACNDPTAHVIAVEPVPSSFRWLSAAIAANALRNVTLVNRAIGAEPGEITLYMDATISGAASSAPSTGPEGLERLTVSTTTIDAVVSETGAAPHVLKLDIEGAELLALRGAAQVLTTHRPLVFCEMLRKLARPFGYHPNDIIALMRGHGYTCFQAVDQRLLRFDAMDESTAETNFYFLHDETHAEQKGRFAAGS